MIFYLLNFYEFKDKSLRVIFFLLTFGFLFDLYGWYCFITGEANFFFYNLFILVQTLFLYSFFYLIFQSKFFKVLLIIASACFLIMWIIFFLRIRSTGYFTVLESVQNISILILSIYFFYEQIFKNSFYFIFSKPHFWIVTAYFIYIAGTFFLILFLTSMNNSEQQEYYSIINYTFTIIRTILLSVAMFMKKTTGDMNMKFKLT